MLNTLAVMLLTSTSFVISANTEQTISFNGIGGVDSGGTGFRTVTNHSGYLISNNLKYHGPEIGPSSEISPDTFIFKADGSTVTHFDLKDINIYAFGSATLTSNTKLVLKDANGGEILSIPLQSQTQLSTSTSAG
jgi:hypothetical protein